MRMKTPKGHRPLPGPGHRGRTKDEIRQATALQLGGFSLRVALDGNQRELLLSQHPAFRK